jgi:DNA-binding transcriptional ArsR family regulator
VPAVLVDGQDQGEFEHGSSSSVRSVRARIGSADPWAGNNGGCGAEAGEVGWAGGSSRFPDRAGSRGVRCHDRVHGIRTRAGTDVASRLTISYALSVEDLADTRFAISPLTETVLSLRILREPGLSAVLQPWRAAVLAQVVGTLDTVLLLSLVGPKLGLPDFLTPRPTTFTSTFANELGLVRRASAELVRRDLRAVYPPGPLPAPLRAADEAGAAPLLELRDDICDLLERYWDIVIRAYWPQMRLVLEADTTYRARQLAVGGARLLFAEMHPNLRWDDGVLYISKMIGNHHVAAAGRGLLLTPSIFAYKPAPPVGAEVRPALSYPARGVATLFAPIPAADTTALASLVGAPKATLLHLLGEPLPTVEIARRLSVTPSAVSQHLWVLHATGLVTRARDGRTVLYRRSRLGDQLTEHPVAAN